MSEKTEKATPKQLRDAREKGQIAQSQDVSKLLILLVVSEITWSLATESVQRLQHLMALAINATGQPFLRIVGQLVDEAVTVLLGFLIFSAGVAMVMRLAGGWAQFGFLFAPKALKIDFNKLNPFPQLKQMFSAQNLTNLLMSILKAAVIGITLYVLLWPELGTLILLANSDLDTYWQSLMEVFRYILRCTLGLLLVLAAVDFGLQKYFHAKKLRMSKDDVKKEYKQSEGDPMVKGQRRQLAHELLNQPPSAAAKPVEEADMLVVNPTHYAVALYYRPGKTPLPMIHCKGEDEDALALIARAKKARIPVVQSVWLARTLYKVNAGRHIPRPTLEAVAHIYQLVKQLDEVTDEIIQADSGL